MSISSFYAIGDLRHRCPAHPGDLWVVLQVSVEELAEIFKGALSWSELEQVCARRRWDGTDPGAFLTGAVFFFCDAQKGGLG